MISATIKIQIKRKSGVSVASPACLMSRDVVTRRYLSQRKAKQSFSCPTFTNCARVAEFESLSLTALKTNAKPFKFIQSLYNTFQNGINYRNLCGCLKYEITSPLTEPEKGHISRDWLWKRGEQALSVKCLDDKEQYVLCQIFFDETVRSFNGALPCWWPSLSSNKWTWGLNLPCCDWWKEDHPVVLTDPISVAVALSRWERVHSEWAPNGSSSLDTMGHVLRAD